MTYINQFFLLICRLERLQKLLQLMRLLSQYNLFPQAYSPYQYKKDLPLGPLQYQLICMWLQLREELKPSLFQI